MKTIEYTPNRIPKSTRVFNFVWGVGLLLLSIYAWYEGSFHLPGKGASNGITFTGNSLLVFISAAMFGAINLFITIADHYDTRDNEKLYKKATFYCSCLAFVLVIAATAMQYSDDQKQPVIIGNGN